ncbi:MAG: HpcH/HpaI aldolase/citrate lyase family protein, partial [Deinococcus sp.]
YAGLDAPEDLARAASTARGLGFGGKQCIHPKQLEAVNVVFSPSSEEVAQAEAVCGALDEARRTGRGAVSLKGRMVDAANIRIAQDTLSHHRRVLERENP